MGHKDDILCSNAERESPSARMQVDLNRTAICGHTVLEVVIQLGTKLHARE